MINIVVVETQSPGIVIRSWKLRTAGVHQLILISDFGINRYKVIQLKNKPFVLGASIRAGESVGLLVPRHLPDRLIADRPIEIRDSPGTRAPHLIGHCIPALNRLKCA